MSMVGRSLEHYEITAQIDEGGMDARRLTREWSREFKRRYDEVQRLAR